MDNLKFSVITPSFNQAKFIEKTILSVLDQNYPNFEHIIIDGGSTDGTVEILKKYPHLKWVSEKDNGQTDALNKGFKLASGNVIAWINSDDWYFPNVFLTVAKYIRDFPIVFGDCFITDGECNVTEKINNVPRSVFDMLKYWIPYSIPTQPAIFFTKQVLEENKLDENYFLDETLNYSMDFEWWLRIWNKYNKKKIDQVFAGYRMYEENKTGQGMVPLEPEMSKVFRRFEGRFLNIEQTFSIVINVCEDTDYERDLVPILQSIYNVEYRDIEIIINDKSSNKKFKKFFKSYIDISNTLLWPKEFAKRIRYFCTKNIDIDDINYFLSKVLHGRFILFLGELKKISAFLFIRSLNDFLQDDLSLILYSDTESNFSTTEDMIEHEYNHKNFLIRNLTFKDVGLLNSFNNYNLSLKEFSLRCIKKGWKILLHKL